ncbi:hypothetical protein Tco_1330127 [Tanacetum coccineum]
MPSSEQSNVVNHSETEITSDSNIIPYSQYVIESQQAAVQNSNSSAQQDALILSVIEQLKTQVANCTKINLENKSVNDTLTAELERYKEQVKVLNEGQNVDLKSNDNVSDSCAQSVEIDHLKQTLSEHLKEKESLIQTVSLLKDDFKKEESRNIDREIALEKRIKQLDNIVFKRDQSAQTVHMLTKPQFFYDHTTKQALGFQNPFYLKKAQQLEPKLYVGDIIEKTNPIMIPDFEETLLLAEESRSKMLLKQNDPIMFEKKANTTPNSVNSPELILSSRPTIVEVPKKLLKVSMVNTSLKKLKHYLAGFDVVVKERTTPTAITEEQAVEQHHLESKTFEVKMNQVLNENERLLEQVLSKDIVNIIMSSSVNNASVNVHECEKCLQLETELQTDFIEKEIYDKLFKSFTTLEKHCISLEVDTQLNQEIFQKDNSVSNQRVKPSTSASGSQPSGNTKKDKIRQTPSSTQKNKVEAHPRKVKSSLKNKDCVVQPKGTAYVQHSKLNANSELKCVKCNGCMLYDNHDLCVLDFINNVNARKKSKSVNKSSKRKVWKPTGKVITTTTNVPLRKPTALENETPKPIVTLVYSRKPRKSKTNVPVSKSKVLKSESTNKKEPSQSWGSIVSDVPSSSLDDCRSSKLFSVKFKNDHVTKILGYNDDQIGNVMISRVYYVEGLGHNLFSVGQFCDSNLEVAFRQHTCFIRNLEDADLLTGSRGYNLYTMSLGDMMTSSPICLLSKALKTKSWI